MKKFTERAQRVILVAQDEAKALNHDYVGPEHILLAIFSIGEGAADRALRNLGLDHGRVYSQILKIIGTGKHAMLLGEIPFTPRAKKVLEYSAEEADGTSLPYIGTEHLLLGLLREKETVVARVLENLCVDPKVVREGVLNLLCAGKKCVSPLERDHLELVTNFIFQLIRSHLPMNRVQDAVAEARYMGCVSRGRGYSNKADPFYRVCEEFADTLLNE